MYVCHLINKLLSSAMGGKTLINIWSGKATQDYDSLRIFWYPAYYHIKEDKLDSRAKKGVFWRFKRGVKCYKIWDIKDKKTILSKNVTFNETSMMKSNHSQQVESKKTTEVPQQVESDATPRTPSSSISFKIPLTVTWYENHAADEDTKNGENQGHIMGQVQNSVAARWGRRNPQKYAWLITNMIVAYAHSIIQDGIPSTYRKQKSILNQRCERNLCWKRWTLFMRTTLENYQNSKGRTLVANECMLRSKNLKMELLIATGPNW